MMASPAFLMMLWFHIAGAFTSPSWPARPISSQTALSMNLGRHLPRRNIRLPLLVDNIDSNSDSNHFRWNVPLPNSHLPTELTTASLYELELDVPIHKMVLSQAISAYDANPERGCCYGHIVWKSGDLVGAIGCAGEVLIGAPTLTGQDVSEGNEQIRNFDVEDTAPLMVLGRGAYRFRVKEVISSIPYPTAIVDELLDDDISSGNHEKINEEEDDDIYDEMNGKELVREVLASLEKVLNIQYDESSKPLSPLEQSILESASSPDPMVQAISRTFDAEERLAVHQTFISSLLDIAPDERDRYYVVAMMAGELAKFTTDVRVQMLTMTCGVDRLRLVLRELNSMLSFHTAKRMTQSISLGVKDEKVEKAHDTIPDFDGIGSINEEIDGMSNISPVNTPSVDTLKSAEDAQKDLMVGIPTLPPWASQIRKGIRIEYFWNEEEGWCGGTVVDDPIKIVDEILITVEFDDDGSVHRLPLRGDDKARWRPP